MIMIMNFPSVSAPNESVQVITVDLILGPVLLMTARRVEIEDHGQLFTLLSGLDGFTSHCSLIHL